MNSAHTSRRSLGETLAELGGSIIELAAETPARATSLELRLPIELFFSAGDEELRGDLPLFRLGTAFDAPPADIRLTFVEVAL